MQSVNIKEDKCAIWQPSSSQFKAPQKLFYLKLVGYVWGWIEYRTGDR